MYEISESNHLPEHSYIEVGDYCDWPIFVHRNTAKTKEIEAKLRNLNERYTDEGGVISFPDQMPGIEVEPDAIPAPIDQWKMKLLQRMEGEKVMIVVFCSC